MEVYLDSAATSRRKPECVYEAVERFLRDIGASPGRSVHGPGISASRLVAEARDRTARLFSVPDCSRIAFGLNCTEALNLAIQGIVKPGDHVVTTGLEHNSVMRPLSAMSTESGVTVTKVAVDGEGSTDAADVARAIRPNTALVAMTHASNVSGTIQPIEACGRVARQHRVPLLVDAAQTAGCVPIDLSRLPVDLLAFSGHKGLMGPQGVGGLYIREGIELAPLKHGGTGSASSEEVQPAMLPDRYESGTPNTPGLAGLAAALDVLSSATVERVRARICEVGQLVLSGLAAIDGIILHGPRDMARNVGIFSFTVRDRDPADVAARLESEYGIMTRVGLQCAPSAHKALGTFPEGTVRASIGYHTTREEAGYFVRSLAELCHG